MNFAAAIDSHYQHVKSRIKAINSDRIVAGMLAAQDWPPKEIKLEAFYLLDLTDTPASRQMTSASTLVTSELVQWQWIVAGSPIATNAKAANRGDRFRTNLTMKGELIQALYPNFCEKQNWARDGNGVWKATSLSPMEYITWTQPEMKQNTEIKSGVTYSVVSLHILHMLDTVTA